VLNYIIKNSLFKMVAFFFALPKGFGGNAIFLLPKTFLVGFGMMSKCV